MPSTDAPILYVFSGAGLSAESGVPTFHTAGGLWTTHNVERLCNMRTWKQNRSDVFSFYAGRRRESDAVAPNDAHRRLAAWQSRWGPDRVRLLTQNVDGLLERAGAQAVVHLHGDLLHLLCTACAHRWPVADDADYAEHTRCPRCDSLKGVKPGVVFFGEMAPEYAHLERLHRDIRPQDVLLVVGSALEVVTVERLVPRRRWGGALNWQVNPEPADPEGFGRVLAEAASTGLLALEQELVEVMDGPGPA